MELEIKIRTNFKWYFTLEEKIKIVEKYKTIDTKTNKHYIKKEICRIYNLDHKQLDQFILNYDEYKKQKNIHNKKIFNKGSKSNFTKEEQIIIINIIESAPSNLTPINYMMITQIIQNKKFKSTENISIHALYQTTEPFLKQNFMFLEKPLIWRNQYQKMLLIYALNF